MTEATTRWRAGKGSRAAATSALGCALMPMIARVLLVGCELNCAQTARQLARSATSKLARSPGSLRTIWRLARNMSLPGRVGMSPQLQQFRRVPKAPLDPPRPIEGRACPLGLLCLPLQSSHEVDRGCRATRICVRAVDRADRDLEDVGAGVGQLGDPCWLFAVAGAPVACASRRCSASAAPCGVGGGPTRRRERTWVHLELHRPGRGRLV